MLGVDKSVEVIDDLGVLVVSGIAIVKKFAQGGGVGAILGSIGELVSVAKSVEELVKDLPGALPELKELDGPECARLGAAAYGLVAKVLVAVKK